MADDRYLDDGWPERYALDRLDESEREKFEAHILDCERCFEEVRLADRYVGAMKDLKDEPVLADGGAGRSVLRPLLAVAATLAIVAVAVWIVVGGGEGVVEPPSPARVAQLLEAGNVALVSLKLPETTYRGGTAPADAESVDPGADGSVAIVFPGSQLSEEPARAHILDAAGTHVAENLGVSLVETPGREAYGLVWDTGSSPGGAYRLLVLSEDGSELGFAWFSLER